MFRGCSIAKAAFSVFVVCICTAGPGFSADECDVTDQMKSESLRMDYQTFDQSLTESPWRQLVTTNDCFESAAELIMYYIKNSDLPHEYMARNLQFHAGQLLAMSNNTILAIEALEKSYWANQPLKAPLDWNTYVAGTIAYLKKDWQGFEATLAKLTQNRQMEGSRDAGNLDVLKRLQACWSKNYYTALQGGEC